MALFKKQDQTQFEKRWPTMQPISLKLLRQEPVTKAEWQDLFCAVYSICFLDDKGPTNIYKALQDDILDLTNHSLTKILQHQEDSSLLKAYIAEWETFFTQCDYFPKPFMQLVRSHGEENLVRKLMLESWHDCVFMKIKQQLQKSVKKLLVAERNAVAFDLQLLIRIRESYVNLSSDVEDKLRIYRENFEKEYLEVTEQFYRQKAPLYLEANGVQNYMRYADCKLKEERARALRFLKSWDSNSLDKLTECCVNVLVTAFKEPILKEYSSMIKKNETENLRLMFSLMNCVPDGITPMLHDMEAYIVSQGQADMIAADETINAINVQNFEKRVEQLIEFFDRFITLINDAFNNDKRFLKARDKAYKAVVNDKFVFRLEIPVNNQSIHQESKCPELLAKYCDILLQKTQLSKKLRSEEVERKLKDALLVLKYIENKDVFLRFHKIHLTRRLILDTSADYEKEENMLKWLREADVSAEYMYMNQLARMLQDIKVSEGFNQEFKGKNKDIADFINIKILSAGAWARSSNRVTVSLPLELGVSISQVELLYSSRHIGRKLQWQHQMSTGIITFDNKFDLEVTTFQMAVLFAWNPRPKDKISYESLKLATELPDTDLRRTLWSLISVPKIQRQLLLCEPDAKSAKDFNDATRFWINEEFALIKNGKVQKRGKINLVGRLQLSTEKSREEEIKGISLLRNERIKEAIVKIMKMRTRISKTALEAELKNMLCNMFTPSPKQIKQQIEWLIEHKYMERDEENINMFIYMA